MTAPVNRQVVLAARPVGMPKAGDFPHSERAADEVLSLPMFGELTTEQCETVVRAVRELAKGKLAAAS